MLKSVQEPERTFQTNVVGTNAVLEAGREAGVTSLAFASTNAVTGPMTAPKISEAAVLNPLTPYGSTKAAGEMLMSAYTASYGLRCACIRLTNVYGPGMQAKDTIVARLMRGIRLGTTFEIYGDGTQVRDYVHVGDVAAAMKLGAHLCGVVGSDGDRLRRVAVGARGRSTPCAQVSGAEVPVRHGPAKPGEMPAVIVDPSKAHAAGWSPDYPKLADGLVGVWEEWSVAEIEAPRA